MTDNPESNHIANDQLDPDHSKPLDVHTWSDHPEINKLVDELWFQVVEPALGGKSNNKGKSDPKRQLRLQSQMPEWSLWSVHRKHHPCPLCDLFLQWSHNFSSFGGP